MAVYICKNGCAWRIAGGCSFAGVQLFLKPPDSPLCVWQTMSTQCTGSIPPLLDQVCYFKQQDHFLQGDSAPSNNWNLSPVVLWRKVFANCLPQFYSRRPRTAAVLRGLKHHVIN